MSKDPKTAPSEVNVSVRLLVVGLKREFDVLVAMLDELSAIHRQDCPPVVGVGRWPRRSHAVGCCRKTTSVAVPKRLDSLI